jgi:hypothetical protein
MRPLTAMILIVLVAGLWVSAYFCEISARILRYFFGTTAGFPRTRRKRYRTRRMELTEACPFCGKKWVLIDTVWSFWGKPKRHRNICLICRTATAWFDTEAQAAEAWDTRAEEAAAVTQNDAEGT